MKTDLEVEVQVDLRQLGKVLIFRDPQTAPNIYKSYPLSSSPPPPHSPSSSSSSVPFCLPHIVQMQVALNNTMNLIDQAYHYDTKPPEHKRIQCLNMFVKDQQWLTNGKRG